MFNVKPLKINPESLENQLNQLTCIYRNESEFIQIIRISQSQVSFFERSILPNQCVQFSALAEALLEIHESSMWGSVHSDTIPCYQLAVTTGIDRKQNRIISKDALALAA